MKRSRQRKKAPRPKWQVIGLTALLYPATFLVCYYGPILAKHLLMPPVGTNTKLFAVVVLSPIAFIMLAGMLDMRLLIAHVVLLALAAGWVALTYSPSVKSIFESLASHDGPRTLPVLYLAGLLAYLLMVWWDERREKRANVDDAQPAG